MNNVLLISARITSSVMDGKNLDKLFIENFKDPQSNLTENKKSQIKAITFDTLRYFKTLSFFLDSLIKKEIQNKLIKYLIIVAMNQLTYGNKKIYALVDEVVNLSKEVDARHSGFVNAVLRNFLRNKEELRKKANEKLESKYNFPLWWIKKIKNFYPNHWEEIIYSQNSHPPMTLRINKKKISYEKYKESLIEANIDFKELSDVAILIKTPKKVDDIIGFNDGCVTVQDLGAQLVANILDLKDGHHVLDACAAPGGKTGHILEMVNVNLTALEIDSLRVIKVNENLDRLGLKAKVINDALSMKNNWWDQKQFDRILLDVPCSGSGVVRRNIDIKWLRRSDDFYKFQKEQLTLLDHAWPLLKKNGKLLYVTCSIFEEENSQVISLFMKKNNDAKILNIEFPENIKRFGKQIVPNENHDGFYYELLEKI